jgi:hypothetical protein
VLRVLIGLESRRRHELGRGCPAAAAGARTPASWRPGLSKKRPGKLLGVLRQAGATRVGGTSGRRVELGVGATGGGNGGSVARGNARGGEFNPFCRRTCLEEGVTAVHGMGTERRWRGATANSSAGAAQRVYGDVAVGWSTRRAWTRGARGEDQDGGSARAAAAHGPRPKGPKPASACGPSMVAARAVRHAGATARSGRQRPKTNQTSTV